MKTKWPDPIVISSDCSDLLLSPMVAWRFDQGVSAEI